MAFAVRIKQNYKLIPEKSLVGLAVSQYDTDTVEFVQADQKLIAAWFSYVSIRALRSCQQPTAHALVNGTPIMRRLYRKPLIISRETRIARNSQP